MADPLLAQQSRPDRYHHGGLRQALIRAADEILAQSGVEGFTLRAAARHADVSPAAPAYHFGSASGLLSEVAALGFDALSAHLQATDPALTPVQRLRAQAMGYVRFALANPGRFQLMFRRDLLDPDHAGLHAASQRAMAQLETTIRACRSLPPAAPLDGEARASVLAAWSTAHGFAHLALGGKLAGHDGAPDALLERTLPAVLLHLWPGD